MDLFLAVALGRAQPGGFRAWVSLSLLQSPLSQAAHGPSSHPEGSAGHLSPWCPQFGAGHDGM